MNLKNAGKFRAVFGVAIGALALAFLTGCGFESRGNPGGLASTVSMPAEGLKLRIVQAGDDPAYPDRSTQAGGSDSDALVTDTEIAFRNIVYLKDKPLFFVWSEDAWGTPIREAQYTHRVQDAENRQLGEVLRKNVSYDEKTRRWFVPLQELVGSRLYDLDPRDVQLLTLDLILSDSSRVQIFVRFRASGPLPAVVPEVLGSGKVDSAQSFEEGVSRNGVVVLRERLENPTSRPFSLWIGGPTEDLKLETLLSVPRWIGAVEAPPRGPFLESALSSGILRIDEVKAIYEDDEELFSLVPGELTRIPFRPAEEVELQWIAHPAPGTPLCAFPPARAHDVSWLRYPDCRRGLYCGPDIHTVIMNEKWFVRGAKLEGNWKGRVLLSNTFSSREEVESGAGLENGVRAFSVDRSIGDPLAGEVPKAKCQGVY